MRIVFAVSGGFASIPSLATPLTVDVSSLPEAEEQELRQLVERTSFFELPSRPARPHAADVRTYRITIEDEGRAHTLTVADPIPAGDLRVLVDRLRWHAAAARRSRGTPNSTSDP